jgi:hypothetical protein
MVFSSLRYWGSAEHSRYSAGCHALVPRHYPPANACDLTWQNRAAERQKNPVQPKQEDRLRAKLESWLDLAALGAAFRRA